MIKGAQILKDRRRVEIVRDIRAGKVTGCS